MRDGIRATVLTIAFIFLAIGLTLAAQRLFDENSALPIGQKPAARLVADSSEVEVQNPAQTAFPKPKQAEMPEPEKGANAASGCGLMSAASCPPPIVTAPETPAPTEPQATELSSRDKTPPPLLDSAPASPNPTPTPARADIPATPDIATTPEPHAHAQSGPTRISIQNGKPLAGNSREFKEIRQNRVQTLSAEAVSECWSHEREAYDWSVNQRSKFPKQQYPERSAKRVACWDTAKAGDVFRFTRYKATGQ